MSVGTAFFPRERDLNHKLAWGEWSGYLSAAVYADFHDIEYNAIREAAAVVDITPLYKYEISGPDAARLLDRVMTRDIAKLGVDRVYYTPWCDEEGKVLDDGTVCRLSEHTYRITAADQCYRWFELNRTGLDAEVRDISDETAALALQGRLSREVLEAATGQDWADMRYFGRRRSEIAGVTVDVTRTGYTGDRGYELWIPADAALTVWDRVFEAGEKFGIYPCGISAMDVARVEAGLILVEVEYTSARHAVAPEQQYSPFELGLGRLVDFNKAADFNGAAGAPCGARRGRPGAASRGHPARLGRYRGDVCEARARARDQRLRAPRPGPRLPGEQAGRARHEPHLGPHDQEDGGRSARSTRTSRSSAPASRSSGPSRASAARWARPSSPCRSSTPSANAPRSLVILAGSRAFPGPLGEW